MTELETQIVELATKLLWNGRGFESWKADGASDEDLETLTSERKDVNQTIRSLAEAEGIFFPFFVVIDGDFFLLGEQDNIAYLYDFVDIPSFGGTVPQSES